MSELSGVRSLLLAGLVVALGGGFAPAQDRPHAYYVLIDTSASMTETPRAPKVPEDWKESKLEAVKRELGRFCVSLPSETEVVIYTFDARVQPGPEVVILGEEDRERLRKFFSEFEAKGKQTHLWRSLAFVLEKVSQSVKATPGKTARVLVYTDGEDNDPAAPDADALLAQYDDLLRDRGQLTYVTLGYTLRSDYQQVLEKHGVRIQRSLSSEDVLPPLPNFSWRPRQPVAGEEVQFIDHSGGVIRDYLWEFGDGTPTSSDKTPAHVFEKPGKYSVVLSITSPRGEKAPMTREVLVVEKVPLKARFRQPPKEVPAGVPVYFVNESQGSVDKFAWDFGDGETSSEQHPVHAFAKPGSYTVKLTVSDTKGNSDEFALENAVRVKPPDPPKVDFIVPSGPVDAGQPVQFFDRSTGLIEKLAWDFGDGSPVSNERDPTHEYAEAKTYTMKLTAAGPGGSVEAAKPVVVKPPEPPKVDFVVPAERVEMGARVQLFDRSRGVIEEYSWEFGDGSAPSAERDPVHQYAKPGKYEVKLTVRGPGGSDTKTATIEVRQHPAPKAALVIGTKKPTVDQEVLFTDQSEGMVTSARWVFGDGTPAVEVDYTGAEAKRSVTHAFAKAGKYTATLAVEGPGGGSEAKSEEIEVVPGLTPPRAEFSVEASEGKAPLTVKFSNKSKGNVTRLTWDFGDGTKEVRETLSDVEHTYAEPGEYVPQLTAEGPEGAGAPHTFTLDQPIHAKSWWKMNAWWLWPLLILLGLLVLAGAGAGAWYGGRRIQRAREIAAMSVLTGSISCKPAAARANWRTYTLPGDSSAFTFRPAESLAPDAPGFDRDQDLEAVLTKRVDEDTFGGYAETYTLALHRGGGSHPESSVGVKPREEFQLGSYHFRYDG
jgi:PKD repeat protein